MFEKNTAFIIGAGASTHFDYPTNTELLGLVRNEAVEIINYNSRLAATYPMPEIVEQLKNDNTGRSANRAWENFIIDCRELVNRVDLNRPVVIDHFLRDNPDVQVLGKTLIAKVICQHEALYFKNLNSQKLTENWVSLIASKMSDKCINPNDIKKNNVHFITFNYDLSLEKLLYKILKSRTKFKNIDFDYLFSEDRFLHVYGAISNDPLSNLSDDFLPIHQSQQTFCDTLNAAYTASLSMQLIDMEEKDKNESVISRSKDILSKADDVYILGYSFDASNNNRLGFPLQFSDEPNANRYREFYFTAYGRDRVSVSRRAGKAIFENEGAFLERSNLRSSVGNGIVYAEKSENKVFDALANDFW